MVQFGFNISSPRTIDMDKNNMSIVKQILEQMPELQSCIACGACTATCTAGAITDFNFRKLHTLVRRGDNYKDIYTMINNCMLCGKCRMVCPRGINTRAVVLLIKQKLGDYR